MRPVDSPDILAPSRDRSAAGVEVLGEMARLEGLEPPTYRFEVCRSIQLSYRRVYRILFESISYGAEFAMRDRRGPSQSAPMAA